MYGKVHLAELNKSPAECCVQKSGAAYSPGQARAERSGLRTGARPSERAPPLAGLAPPLSGRAASPEGEGHCLSRKASFRHLPTPALNESQLRALRLQAYELQNND